MAAYDPYRPIEPPSKQEARKWLETRWDWSEDLGTQMGMYAAVAYFVLLVTAAALSASVWVYLGLLLGLGASIASIFCANLTEGDLRCRLLVGLALLSLMVLLIVLIAVSWGVFFLGILLALENLSVVLVLATMLARRLNTQSEFIRRTEYYCAAAGLCLRLIATVLIAIIVTIIFRATGSSEPPVPGRGPALGFWGGLLAGDFILIEIILWTILIVGLVNSRAQRDVAKLADAGLWLGKTLVALLGLLLLFAFFLGLSTGALFSVEAAVGAFFRGIVLLISASAALLVVVCPAIQFVAELSAWLLYLVGGPEPEEESTKATGLSPRRSRARRQTQRSPHTQGPRPTPTPPKSPTKPLGMPTPPPEPDLEMPLELELEPETPLPAPTSKSPPPPPRPAKPPPLPPAARPPPIPSKPRPPTAMVHRDREIQKQLARLEDLLARGLLTRADYDRKRKELLDGK